MVCFSFFVVLIFICAINCAVIIHPRGFYLRPYFRIDFLMLQQRGAAIKLPDRKSYKRLCADSSAQFSVRASKEALILLGPQRHIHCVPYPCCRPHFLNKPKFERWCTYAPLSIKVSVLLCPPRASDLLDSGGPGAAVRSQIDVEHCWSLIKSAPCSAWE